MPNLSQKSYAIIGLGQSGLSVAHYLSKRGMSYSVFDENLSPSMEAALPNSGCQAKYKNLNIDILRGFSHLVLSPGVDPQLPSIQAAQQAGATLLNDIELFAQEVKVPVIAVTGSNGKSTVVSLLQALLLASQIKSVLAGNIGTPVLNTLDQDAEVYILELSSFQLELLHSLKPKVACVLNVSADHLDRHGNLANYRAAKERIYQGSEHIVFNADEPMPRTLPACERQTSFGLKADADFKLCSYEGEDYLAKQQQKLLKVSQIKLPGQHNLSNCLAVLALADAYAGLKSECLPTVFENFKGLDHRSQWVRSHQGVSYINDSKATNVGASAAALRGLASSIQGQWILIAGGISKTPDLSVLLPAIKAHCRAIVLIGRDQLLFQKAFAPFCQTYLAPSMKAAVELSCSLAKAGDGVLLSPAGSSFDMFKNYMERGQAFAEAVNNL